LEQAEGRIQVLVEGKGGKMQVAEMELDDEEDGDEIEIEEADDEE
jgi:hypothetical protein